MNRLINWIKHNPVTLILLAILLYLVFKPTYFGSFSMTGSAPDRMSYQSSKAMSAPSAGGVAMDSAIMPVEPELPPTQSPERLVIRDTDLSLLVNDVPQATKQIQTVTQDLGGFLVNANVHMPEGAASGSIVVRVPVEKRDEALAQFKAIGVKTVSETVNGRDVTAEYTDIQSRLDTLNQTKAKYDAILADAVRVADIMDVQQQIISLQDQIDQYKGREEYLKQSAALTKISVNLSTDELALPYTPDGAWRPQLVFKEAVRSFILNLRELGNFFIWLLVYSPVWLLILIGWWLVRRKLAKPLPRP